jgi:hypothetical protein
VDNPHRWSDPLGLIPCEEAGTIGQEAKAIPKGGGQLSHISDRVTGLGLDQQAAAEATEEAARVAFGRTGGQLPLENGNIAVLPSQPQVGAWFEVEPGGAVIPRRGTIGFGSSGIVLTPR